MVEPVANKVASGGEIAWIVILSFLAGAFIMTLGFRDSERKTALETQAAIDDLCFSVAQQMVFKAGRSGLGIGPGSSLCDETWRNIRIVYDAEHPTASPRR